MPHGANILLITADQLRSDALGCYGNTVCQTPYLDALAGSGVVFENAFTPNPICVPARASITTGNYSHFATGTKNNCGLIHDDQPILAQHFAKHGYRTYACGKLHYLPYAPPDQPRLLHGFQHSDLGESGRIVYKYDPNCLSRGIEDYIDFLSDNGWPGWSRAHGVGNNDVRACPSPLPAELNVDHWVADCTIKRLQEHKQKHSSEPFLIWCSFPKPHSPFDPPAEFASMYDPRALPTPLGDATMLLNRTPYLQYVRQTHAIDTLSSAALKVIKSYYYGLVSFQDQQIGRLLQALNQLGLTNDTIVIYAADHGELLGDFGAYFKCSFLKGSLNVPLIIRVPGVQPGQRRTQLVGLQDIFPSLATMTNCPLSQQVHGWDLSPILNDQTAPGRELFYGQCLEHPRQSAMVTDGKWKYIYSQQGPTEQLYDLSTDPDELNNLAVGCEAESLPRSWRERLIDQARRLGDLSILTDKGLATSPLDRDDYAHLPITGMGWRKY